MKTTKLLTIMIALQIVTLAGQWLGQPTMVQTASAQIPDAGSQRLQMIDEMKSTNAKLDHLIGLLESGKVQVRTISDDKK